MDRKYFSADVDLTLIDPSARISGQTLISGKFTRIGPGAEIRDSYLENVEVAEGAKITDSILITKEPIQKAAASSAFRSKWAINASPVKIGKAADVKSSTIWNTGLGEGSRCVRSAVYYSTIGSENILDHMYGQGMHTEAFVKVIGPTEVMGAWLGHHAVIDKCGYFEGTFSNDLYVLEYDESRGELAVKETLDLPHASRYGMNVINSDNSGKLLPQPEGKLKSIGKHIGLWHDQLLSHEPLTMGPACLVSGWTKVIGKSALVHASAEEFIKDSLATYLMPFGVSGFGGGSVTGQVLSGELNNGYSYKNRVPAWIFNFAPGAVFGMVRRIYEITKDKELSDRIVTLSLKNALALTYYYAKERSIELVPDPKRSAKAWKEWLLRSKTLLESHIGSGLWEFERGEPKNWRQENGKWVPKIKGLAEDRFSEDDILKCEYPPLERDLGVKEAELSGTLSDTVISKDAKVSKNSFIGPGVKILGSSVIGDNVWLYRTMIKDSLVAEGSRLLRSSVENSRVEENCSIVSTSVKSSSIGKGSNLRSAVIDGSKLSLNSTVHPFANIKSCKMSFPCIVGTTLSDVEAGTICMSYHMPGQASCLKVIPTKIKSGEKEEVLYPVPMFGGGMRVLGTNEKNVITECSFIGSNTVIDAGAFIGYGCFILGTLGGEEGLLPFTISTSAGPEKDQIGAASQFANIIISHFISWAYQANDIEYAPSIGNIVVSKLKEGKEAVAAELTRRADHKEWDGSAPYAIYKSLKLYTDDQLRAALSTYEAELSDDRWCMGFVGGELVFTGKGSWVITDGNARWEAEV